MHNKVGSININNQKGNVGGFGLRTKAQRGHNSNIWPNRVAQGLGPVLSSGIATPELHYIINEIKITLS